MTDPKFVAFSTQKGGAGKTTLTVLAASYLYYVKGLKVLVVDCDYPQYSIEEMRQRDKDLIEFNPRFKKYFADNFRQTGLQPYPLLTAKPEEAMQKVRDIIEAGNEFDIVFFDLPGTVNNRSVVSIINCMDTVIVPIAADKVILESSLAFALKKFTIPDDKQLVIEVAEKDGGRHQSFVVENEDIVRANVIDELSIQ